MGKQKSKKDGSAPKNEKVSKGARTTFKQAVILIFVSLLLFFVFLEGVLSLMGVKSVYETEDPFVGFASTVPLYVPLKEPGSAQVMVTAPNKLTTFNKQEFMREKPPGTFRIFCLGGSTTYGRPYNDTTSFAGWLRELLPLADPEKNWEVINAGGISYASYRVTHLMEELIRYDPDLFVIYTGQNEFLEERTYRNIRKLPSLVRSTASLLARTRTWSAMKSVIDYLGIDRQNGKNGKDILSANVDAILDRSIGPDDYVRNDPLKKQILEHYRISLERMVALARSVGARVIFVTPGSNLKDCTPFKSQHTPGLKATAIRDSKRTLVRARTMLDDGKYSKALSLLGQALDYDPRYAGLWYYRGKALLALNRDKEAEKAFQRARDEDVCPLRALTPMRAIVSGVAKENGTGLVDYVGILKKRMQSAYGYPIPGKEFFLDHVHPTIDGNRILAVALVQDMADQGLARPASGWKEQAVQAAKEKIDRRIDREYQGQALANLARVLLWAGKKEDAARLAGQAMKSAGDYPHVSKTAATVLSTYNQRRGRLERARELLHLAIEGAPDTVVLRRKLGSVLLERPFLEVDKAAANLLWVLQQRPDSDEACLLFGQAMLWRGRLKIAYASLMRALELNPGNETARKTLARIRPLLGENPPTPRPHRISLETYPSGAPRKLVQLGRDAEGRIVPDGIEVQFYNNGRVRRLTDFDKGARRGLEITWDKRGHVLSRIVDRGGKKVHLEAGLQALHSAIQKTPDTVVLRRKLGSVLLERPFLEVDKAAANLLWVLQQRPDSDEAWRLFGQAMARRGRLRIAYASLMRALELNPGNETARKTLARIRPLLGENPPTPRPHRISLETYPSDAPRKLVQLGRDTEGRIVPDGIEVQFYNNGRVRRLTDFDKGVRNGLEMAWNKDGTINSCVVSMEGTPGGLESGHSGLNQSGS